VSPALENAWASPGGWRTASPAERSRDSAPARTRAVPLRKRKNSHCAACELEGAAAFAGGEFAELDVEGMAAETGGGVAFGAEGEGELLARAAEFALGRVPLFPREVVEVEFARRERREHGGGRGGGHAVGFGVGRKGFFAVEVMGGVGAEEEAGRAERVFVGVGIMAAVDGRVVGDDEDFEIGGAGVDELVGGAGRVDEAVAGADGKRAVGRAGGAGAGLDEEEFPLREVGVIGADGGAGRKPAKLDVERMTAGPCPTISDTAEREGNVATERVEFAGGRAEFFFSERRKADVVHGVGGAAGRCATG